MNTVIKLDKPGKFKQAWQSIKKAELNGQVIWLALFKGEYYWHKHNQDELFYVVSGQILIQMKNHSSVKLKQGQMFIVQKNIWHCPKSLTNSIVLMIEPKDIKTIKPTAGMDMASDKWKRLVWI